MDFGGGWREEGGEEVIDGWKGRVRGCEWEGDVSDKDVAGSFRGRLLVR